MSDHKIDLSFLENFTKGDPVKMIKYIKMFLQAAPVSVQTMKNQLAKEDWDNLRSSAHSLKPQLSYMGINHLKEVIVRIEEYSRERQHLGDISSLIDRLDQQLQPAMKELNDAVVRLSD